MDDALSIRRLGTLLYKCIENVALETNQPIVCYRAKLIKQLQWPILIDFGRVL